MPPKLRVTFSATTIGSRFLQPGVWSPTAMGRASAYVLVGMPFFLAAMIFLIDRSYIRPLWATNAGHIMVIIGLISMSLGALACRKIVNFKY